jgi:hypothetical protein
MNTKWLVSRGRQIEMSIFELAQLLDERSFLLTDHHGSTSWRSTRWKLCDKACFTDALQEIAVRQWYFLLVLDKLCDHTLGLKYTCRVYAIRLISTTCGFLIRRNLGTCRRAVKKQYISGRILLSLPRLIRWHQPLINSGGVIIWRNPETPVGL